MSTRLLYLNAERGDQRLVDAEDTGQALRKGVGGSFDVIAFDFGDLWVPDDNADVPWHETPSGEMFQHVNEIAMCLILNFHAPISMEAGGIVGDCVLSGPADAEGETTSVTVAGLAHVAKCILHLERTKARLAGG